jgi:hypothetical protein
MTKRQTQYFSFSGGENHSDPALSIPPGDVIASLNYELNPDGGYQRVDGFERFDGRQLPSETDYYILPFESGVREVFTGDSIIGGTSTAQGIIIEVVVESGDWSTNDAAGYFVYIVQSGVFIDDELINISVPEAFSSGFNSGFR